jgi:hypothetical protein
VVRHALLGSKKQMDSEQFIEALYSVDPSLRAAYLPRAGDTTTTTTLGRVWTHDGTIAARITTQGNGVLVTFNGTSNEADTPDTADLSFGDGTTDSPMSMVALCNVTDTAATRSIFCKGSPATPSGEYGFQVVSNDTLQLRLVDQSAGVQCNRLSNAAITMGSLVLLGATYDGRGGATAANGITLYQNAAVLASTANNNASYEAMENTNTVGALANEVGTRFFAGDMGFFALWAAELSATQMEAVKLAVEEYYGVNL